MLFDIYVIVFLFIIGMLMGSFYTVVGHRLPNDESIVAPRSHCNNCNHVLAWYELIPVISFLIQGGRCRKCKIKLSLIYPIIEMLSGFLFALSYVLYGFSYEMIAFIIISSVLITIYVSDFNYMIILDGPLIIGSLLILLLKLYFFGFRTFVISVVSGLVMFMFMYIIKLAGDKWFGRESLGGGDVKLSIFFGFVFGVRLAMVSLVLGSFLAFPYALYCSFSENGKEIPFGPFLITGLLIVYMYMEPIKEILNLLIF